MDDNSPGQDNAHSIFTRHAADLQKSAQAVTKRISEDPRVNLDWSLSAQVFPESVIIMAACSVAGSDPQLGVVPLSIPIPGSTETPSAMSALLDSCSQQGRKAFSKASSEMTRLNLRASSALGPNGMITRIMHLVKSSKATTHALRDEILALRAMSVESLQSIRDISTSFANWSEFINQISFHFDQYLLVTRSGQESPVDLEWARAEVERTRNDLLQKEHAQNEAGKVHARALAADADKPLSKQEILSCMKRIYPQEDKRWPGIKNCLAYLWNGDRKEEDDIDARVNKHVKEVLQILEQSTQQQKQQKEDAQLRIEMSTLVIPPTIQVAKKNLHLLAEKNLNLQEIDRILRTSAVELQKLNVQVASFEMWFEQLSILIDNIVNAHFGSVSRTLRIHSPVALDVDADEGRRLSREDKEQSRNQHLLHHLFQIQGYLSAIEEISRLYSTISEKYIQPGIDHLDCLDRSDLAIYQLNRKRLSEWHQVASHEIHQLMIEGTQTIPANVNLHVRTVVDKAIEHQEFWLA
ncbi:hypothetical protein KXW87_009106 [Aspergillus fumigatus]|nr:hypothetical protein KXX10_008172 [Aspergillus fumigatus]KAH1758153.1 hypothetical protein KXX41_006253 [Aspergillus fumigatus]KAH2333731.1 hypothetical protein KXW87_009106 [Aspergillus fumigatus]KAH2414833.1 hypothetical protein KXW64_009029 [Aspergillus fumigatus]KAH3345962.1 hypothetical protein KXW44_002283 [Aspergillus fumigatus]